MTPCNKSFSLRRGSSRKFVRAAAGASSSGSHATSPRTHAAKSPVVVRRSTTTSRSSSTTRPSPTARSTPHASRPSCKSCSRRFHPSFASSSSSSTSKSRRWRRRRRCSTFRKEPSRRVFGGHEGSSLPRSRKYGLRDVFVQHAALRDGSDDFGDQCRGEWELQGASPISFP
jgi:hypothetical protein